MRRRLDEAVAWEHEVSGGTYGAPRIRYALTRAGVDVGMWAVAASMRRLAAHIPLSIFEPLVVATTIVATVPLLL